MMRAPFQPLAHLVDAIAEKWCAAEDLPPEERAAVYAEITHSFNIGDKPELTFHGVRYILTIARAPATAELSIGVHEIVTPG